MGIVEELAGRGINRALQLVVKFKGEEKYDTAVDAMRATGVAMQQLADNLEDRKLTPEEIDTMARGLYKNLDGVTLETVRASVERIIAAYFR